MSEVTLFRHASNRREYESGTILFLEGQPGDTLYAVVEGLVDLFVGETRIATVGPGGIVGEMALVSQQPRSATAITRTDCVLVPVDRQQFTYMVQQTPFFATQVMGLLAERLRDTTSQALNSALAQRAMVGRD